MRTLRLFKTVITYSLLMILTLSLNSCFILKGIESKYAKTDFTTENDAIPPSFGENNAILLCVLKDRNSYDKFLKSAVKKNYKGEYVLIYSSDLSSDKYKDLEKYRYIFDYDDGTVNTTSWSDGLSASSTMKRFYVGDRLEKKIYQTGTEYSYFANAMKIYMTNLEIKRMSSNH